MTLSAFRPYLICILSLGALGLAAPVLAQTGATPAAAAATPAANIPPSPAGNGQAASPAQLFADWDRDRNGQLSLEEFSAGWDDARQANMIGRLEVQFRSADSNRSGLIEAAEFAALPVIKRAGGGAPPLSAFDANKDGKLDFKEYLGLVQAMIKRNNEGAR